MHLVSYFVPVSPAGEFLLVAHRGAGLLLPPGGHCEPGEEPWDTVARECREELFIDAVPAAAFGRRPVFVTVTATRDPTGLVGSHVDVSLWFVIQTEPACISSFDESEFTALRWMPPAEILAHPAGALDPHLHRFVAKYVSQANG